MKKYAVASLLVLTIALVAVGCGGGSGASGAEAAVQKFLTASENKDVDAILELTDPQIVAAMQDELTGTGMSEDDVKAMLRDQLFPYDSVQFANIKLQTTETGENEAIVAITEGSRTLTSDGASETLSSGDSDEPLEFYLFRIDGQWYIDFGSL